MKPAHELGAGVPLTRRLAERLGGNKALGRCIAIIMVHTLDLLCRHVRLLWNVVSCSIVLCRLGPAFGKGLLLHCTRGSHKRTHTLFQEWYITQI
jgi:hypothetical protein